VRQKAVVSSWGLRLSETPSSFANRSAARLIEAGSFSGYVPLLMS
jgi:hypothetical protein